MFKALSAYNVSYLKITFVQSEFSPHAYDTLFNSMITSIKSQRLPYLLIQCTAWVEIIYEKLFNFLFLFIFYV